MIKIIGLGVWLLGFSFLVFGQEYKQKPYRFAKLTQETITITHQLSIAPIFKNWSDTSITIYQGGSVEMMYYFVDGCSYESLYGGAAGLYINKQYFRFYLDTQKKIKTTAVDILQVNEFTYLGKKYLSALVIVTISDNQISCIYNVFDITNLTKITQFILPTSRIGSDAFGDFNFDGQIDFISVIDHVIDNFTPTNGERTFKATAYTFGNDKTKVLETPQTQDENYIIGIGNNQNIDSFMIINENWCIRLKMPNKAYMDYRNYYSGSSNGANDVKNIYTIEGLKVERRSYSLVVAQFDNDTKLREMATVLSAQKINEKYVEVYVGFEIVKDNLQWLLLAGNYHYKTEAESLMKKLEKKGYAKMSIRKLH